MASESTKGDQNTFGDTVSKISTGGVKNIEAAYQRQGASEHHTPEYAGTLGSQEGSNAGKAPGLRAAQGKSQEVCFFSG